jgi:hypothetical protein
MPKNKKTKKNGSDMECIEKINTKNLVKGVFNTLLSDIIYSNIDENKINMFCKNYIILHKNERNRAFPRTAKTPFCKWYLKGYNETTKYSKIIDAISNNDINKLDKQLKKIALTIVSIENG